LYEREGLDQQLEEYLKLPTEDFNAHDCKGNLTDLRRILHLSLAKGNPK
jgi:hypothetical protein